MERKRLVFVSHSGKDTWVARQIARLVAQRGAEVFLDVLAIQAGDDFSEQIRAALRRAEELLVLWTPTALDRRFIWAEVGGAWTRGIPIVQVLYGPTAAELQALPDFPPFLKGRDRLRLDDLDRYLDELSARIGRAATSGEERDDG